MHPAAARTQDLIFVHRHAQLDSGNKNAWYNLATCILGSWDSFGYNRHKGHLAVIQ